MIQRRWSQNALAFPDSGSNRPPARAAVLVAFLAGDLALSAVAIAVFSSTWLDPLTRAARGLVNDTLVVNVVELALLVGVVMLGVGRLRPVDFGVRRADLRVALTALVVLWLATQVVGIAAGWMSTGSIALHPLWARRGVLGVLGLLLAQVCGNALVEEIGYRGFLLPQVGLRLEWIGDHRGRLALAVVVSQALFALAHVPIRLWEGVTGSELAAALAIVFALGVLFALLYLRTGNLLLVVGVHALINTPTLLVASPIGHEIVEGLAVLLLVAWPWLPIGRAPVGGA